jgi:hypothetical protein
MKTARTVWIKADEAWKATIAAHYQAERDRTRAATELLVNIFDNEYEPRIVLYPGARRPKHAPEIRTEPETGH